MKPYYVEFKTKHGEIITDTIYADDHEQAKKRYKEKYKLKVISVCDTGGKCK